MSNAKTISLLNAQITSYKEGIATFKTLVARNKFQARDERGCERQAVAAQFVLQMLGCIEADAEDVIDCASRQSEAPQAGQSIEA